MNPVMLLMIMEVSQLSSNRLVSYFTICLIMGSIIALSALSINVVADGGEEDPLAEEWS